MKAAGKQAVGTVSFDVSTRKHVQYDHQKKRFTGFIHLGKRNSDGSLPVANNVLVFMFTSLNCKDSIPIAYYAVKSLDAQEKRDLILEILSALHSIDVKVANITFDGLRSNIATCNLLGASLDPKNLVPYFPHPIDKSNVYVMLDACHALKLVRNALGDLGRINDPRQGSILWKHYMDLNNLKDRSMFVTHRLNKRHIQYSRNRMNVRLAAQIFSNSAAASMAHLKRIGVEEFQNCESTISFTENMDKTFDTMNSKEDRPGFKGVFNANNYTAVFEHFDYMNTYIRQLKFYRKLCINSCRKTGFIAILINMIVIRRLYEELVQTGVLECLPTFYLSQDVLESFFSRIRSLLGANDNPTQQQFKSAIRKLLFINEVCSSDFANCEDNLNMLEISSASSIVAQDVVLNEQITNTSEFTEEESMAIELIREEEILQNDTNLLDATIAFFAGSAEAYVESNLLKQLKCSNCT